MRAELERGEKSCNPLTHVGDSKRHQMSQLPAFQRNKFSRKIAKSSIKPPYADPEVFKLDPFPNPAALTYNTA